MAKKATPEVEPLLTWRLHLSNGKAPITPDMTKTDLLAHITEERWFPTLGGCLVNPLQVVMIEQV